MLHVVKSGSDIHTSLPDITSLLPWGRDIFSFRVLPFRWRRLAYDSEQQFLRGVYCAM